jgi:hypothetical protein
VVLGLGGLSKTALCTELGNATGRATSRRVVPVRGAMA